MPQNSQKKSEPSGIINTQDKSQGQNVLFSEAEKAKALADLESRYGAAWVAEHREGLEEQWQYAKDF